MTDQPILPNDDDYRAELLEYQREAEAERAYWDAELAEEWQTEKDAALRASQEAVTQARYEKWEKDAATQKTFADLLGESDLEDRCDLDQVTL